MAATRVGIMGFGHTGRNVFRILSGRSDIEVVAICDTVPADQLVYLLRFDTLFGRFEEPVSLAEGRLDFRGRAIRFWSSFSKAAVPPWHEERVDVVLDCTARALTREQAEELAIQASNLADALAKRPALASIEQRVRAKARQAASVSATLHRLQDNPSDRDVAATVERQLARLGGCP